MDHDSSTSTSSSSGIIYICTESDGNNLFWQYQSNFPSYNPENTSSLDQLCDGQAFQHSDPAPLILHLGSQLSVSLRESYFTPFLNTTIWHLMGWFYSGLTQKSLEDLNTLV
ncbi:hypothetical protein J3R82DRAFT_9424 [Butyriboletus roseoflavus]|nr:hypothetical protein J3R82DRAFT_9424 [Butyriboletus roseoflavus]